MRKPLRIVSLFALLLILAACGGDPQLDFSAELTPEAEVPAPTLGGATPSGDATATLNEAETQLIVSGNFEGLTGPATGAHIHGPAEEGETAGVIFPLVVDGTTSGTLSGTWSDIDASEIEQLRDGQLYVNVHTEANSPGEIRGQLE